MHEDRVTRLDPKIFESISHSAHRDWVPSWIPGERALELKEGVPQNSTPLRVGLAKSFEKVTFYRWHYSLPARGWATNSRVFGPSNVIVAKLSPISVG